MWRLSPSGDGMAFAPHHRVHLVDLQPFESHPPRRCAAARLIPGRTVGEGEGRVGYRAFPKAKLQLLGHRLERFDVHHVQACSCEAHPDRASFMGHSNAVTRIYAVSS